MPEVTFLGRQATTIENNSLRVTVLHEGGHIAEIFDMRAGVSPLWIPQWQSVEPSQFNPSHHHSFGRGSDAKLLAGIMGHNLCLDLFGGPSPEEAEAGFTAHGEASVNRYEIAESSHCLTMHLRLPLAQLSLNRSIQLIGNKVAIRETVTNLTAFDRPIAWTQHVTLGPPFLDPATTQFRASMTQSVVCESDPGSNAYLSRGTEFAWPLAPYPDGTVFNLQQMHPTAPASGYTAHLANPHQEDAFFLAYSPQYELVFGYVWKRSDFPWMGIWEENCSRRASPWNGSELTRGMEFGVSPFPESRREMVERGRLFDTPTFRWLPAKAAITVEYSIHSLHALEVPESLSLHHVAESIS